MKRLHGASVLVALVALAVMAGGVVAQGVDVSAFEPRVSATPGEYVSVALSLTYHGTVAEAVEVVVQVPGPGWTFLSDRKRVTLEPETPKTMFMTFMPPADLPAGEIVVRFRVLSVVQGLDVGGTEVRLTITPHVRLVVTAPGSTSLAPGDAATYTFVVRNEGNSPVTASVRVQTQLESADRDGETRMQLVAGETRPLSVTVRVPTEGAPQDGDTATPLESGTSQAELLPPAAADERIATNAPQPRTEPPQGLEALVAGCSGWGLASARRKGKGGKLLDLNGTTRRERSWRWEGGRLKKTSSSPALNAPDAALRMPDISRQAHHARRLG